MSMGKQVIVILGSVFAVALAVVVGKQLSTEAMAVIIGVVCGVAAGIPTSVLLLVVLTRRERQAMDRAQRQVEYRRSGYPPVVVTQGERDPAMCSLLRSTAAAKALTTCVPVEMEPWLKQAPAGTDGRFYVAERDDHLLGGG